MAFNIVEEAFPALKAYLDKIKAHFLSQEGGREIVDDIEIRIAELFNDRLGDDKNVIEQSDVEEVIAQMGQPFEMDEDLDDETSETKNESRREQTYGQERIYDTNKRVFRDPDDKVLGGVCSGLALYLGIDALWLRLIFIISVFTAGIGVIPYLILWIAIPEARTTAEKLRMRGRPVNVSNIEETIKDSFKDIRDGIKDRAEDPETRKRVKNGARDIGDGIERMAKSGADVLAQLLKAAGKFFAIIFLIACAGGLISTFFWFFSASMVGFAMADFIGLFFENSFHAVISSIGLFLLSVIPLLAIILVAVRVLFKSTLIKGVYFSVLLAVWIISLLTLTAEGIYHGLDFRDQAPIDKEIALNSTTDNRYYVRFQEKIEVNGTSYSFRHSSRHHRFNDNTFFQSEGVFYIKDNVYFRTEPSIDNEFHLVIVKKARGRNFDQALTRAERLSYDVEVEDSVIEIDPYIKIADGDVWRDQTVDIILQMPENGELVFQNTGDIHNKAASQAGFYYGYDGKVLIMRNGKLKDAGTVTSTRSSNGYRQSSLKDFDRLEFNSFDKLIVEVVYDENYSLQIAEDLADDGSLEIVRSRGKVNFKVDEINMYDDKPHIKIGTPELEKIEVNGQVVLIAKGFNQRYMKVSVGGNSKANLHGQIDQLYCEVHGASTLNAVGTADYVKAEMSGISTLYAFDLTALSVDLEISGASTAQVFASKNLDVEANGKCDVRYKGHPKVESDLSGISSIESVN